MKENFSCMMCGYRCIQIETKNGSRLLQDIKENFYLNIVPI